MTSGDVPEWMQKSAVIRKSEWGWSAYEGGDEGRLISSADTPESLEVFLRDGLGIERVTVQGGDSAPSARDNDARSE